MYNGDKPKSLYKVSTSINLGYCSFIKIVGIFKEKGLITTDKKGGRMLYVSFTQKGESLVNNIDKVLEAVNHENKRNPEQI